jgi:hypothetical protein
MTTDNTLPSVKEVLEAYAKRDAAARKEQEVEARIFASGPSATDPELLDFYAQLKDERAKCSLEAARLFMLADEATKADVQKAWKDTREGRRKEGGIKAFTSRTAREFANHFPLVLAIPGSGKTTVVKALNEPFQPGARPAVDLDIKGPKGRDQPALMSEALSFYVKAALTSHVSVFSFLHYFDWTGVPDVPTFIFVPDEGAIDAWIERIGERDGKDAPFFREAKANLAQWQKDWVREADRLKQAGREIHLVRMEANEHLYDAMMRIYHD